MAAASTRPRSDARRARRVRRVPGRAGRRRTPAPRTPRCWPAPAPAADCGSRSSATRSWSPPRPVAGSRCPAAARSSPSGAIEPPTTTSRDLDRARRRAAHRRHRRRQRRGAAGRRARARRRWLARTRSWSPATSRPRPRWPPCSPGCPHVLADNVVPRIGVLAPDCARAAIREMFLSHVIGGKHLSSRGDDFTAMVRGATPDVVLTGVELLARGLGPEQPGAGDVVVVDVGGATTDVHSVVELDPEARPAWPARWSPRPRSPAPSRATWACAGRRSPPCEEAGPGPTWPRRPRGATDPGLLPADDPRHEDAEREVDEAIARAAVDLALRRHAGRSRVVRQPRGAGRRAHRQGPARGRPAGGVGRRAAARRRRRRATGARAQRGEHVEGGWQLPRAARVVVDRDYVLAAAGLLVAEHPAAAYRLVSDWRAEPVGSLHP